MIVQLDKIVMNKTEKYLKPCLKYHGENFTNRLSLIFKLGYGIGDMLIDKKYEQHIFVLIDTFKCVQFWTEFIEDYFRELDFYEDDYAVDNLENGRLHMLVIKLPEKASGVVQRLMDRGYAVGLPLGIYYSDRNDQLLVSVTEKRTREEIEGLATVLEGILWN